VKHGLTKTVKGGLYDRFFQYIPKKESFENFKTQDIKEIQFKLNRRPREKLKFYSPKEVFFASLNNKVALAG